MRKEIIASVVLFVFVIFASASLAKITGTLPKNGGTGLPYANPKIAVEFDKPINPAKITVEMRESLSGTDVPISIDYRGKVNELGYWYKFTYPVYPYKYLYYYETVCFSLVIEPTQNLKPGTRYDVLISDQDALISDYDVLVSGYDALISGEMKYQWDFTTSADIAISSEYVIADKLKAGFSRPGGDIGPDGTPWYVWQEFNGTHVQKEGEREVHLKALEYSDSKGPAITVDPVTGEAYVVGMENWPLNRKNDIMYYVAKFSADGKYKKIKKWTYWVPGYVFNIKHYAMQLTMAGMSVSAYGGRVAVVFQVPYCYSLSGKGQKDPSTCHNYIIGKVLNSNLKEIFPLGDQDELSELRDLDITDFREDIVNDPLLGSPDNSYHYQISMSAKGFSVVGMKYDSSLPDPRLDDVAQRIFGSNGKDYSGGERQVNTNVDDIQGFDQWAATTKMNNNGMSGTTDIDRIRDDMGKKDGADVMLFIVGLNGKRLTEEMRANQTRINDQINPNIDWIDDETLLVVWMSLCQDCGGQGQMGRIYKWKKGKLFPDGDEFRWNDLNSIRLDTEELFRRHHTLPEALSDPTHTIWSEYTGLGCNRRGSCIMTYPLRNSGKLGRGTEVRAVWLCTPKADADEDGVPDCIDQNYE